MGTRARGGRRAVGGRSGCGGSSGLVNVGVSVCVGKECMSAYM